MAGLSKISVQSGTSHGGVVLADGSIADVKLDLDTLETLSRVARDEYGLRPARCSTARRRCPTARSTTFPKRETAEIHLATNFQNMLFDHMPAELRDDDLRVARGATPKTSANRPTPTSSSSTRRARRRWARSSASCGTCRSRRRRRWRKRTTRSSTFLFNAAGDRQNGEHRREVREGRGDPPRGSDRSGRRRRRTGRCGVERLERPRRGDSMGARVASAAEKSGDSEARGAPARSDAMVDALWLARCSRSAVERRTSCEGALNGVAVNLEVARSRSEKPDAAGIGGRAVHQRRGGATRRCDRDDRSAPGVGTRVAARRSNRRRRWRRISRAARSGGSRGRARSSSSTVTFGGLGTTSASSSAVRLAHRSLSARGDRRVSRAFGLRAGDKRGAPDDLDSRA